MILLDEFTRSENFDSFIPKGSGLRLAFVKKDQRSAFSTFLRQRILPDGGDAVFYLTVEFSTQLPLTST